MVAVVLATSGIAVVAHGLTRTDGPPRPAADQTATSQPRASASPTSDTRATRTDPTMRKPTASPHDFGPVLPDARPVSLDVPAIDVHVKQLIGLGYDAHGGLEVPMHFDDAGWFSAGPSPGQLGPAVIAGHVDSKAGPAVFYRLGELRRGDTIGVTRDDDTTATFVVDRVEEHPKDDFPTSEVYGNTTDRAELRLITCGGDFNHRTGHYADNIIVFAHLVP